ncbi:methyl-accepting chemotaxis protein [Brenneria rubrifaciens]|uniref:HAMP domain-containing protein n=1 Tax=Brenneria rubrifaciens TaxID=55213 RepID=A0A4P8QMR0_9GAMM|nr:methyl-accepting chemotaxis protein [Brenneria rubrifaciens]QCR08231.1 HAMP domain-containing protein [Brenneria rubrifaciens]
MLNRIKVVTSLMLVLVLFVALQLVSGGLFFNALKNDRDTFSKAQVIDKQKAELDATWSFLLQTRITLSRASSRMLQANENGTSNSAAIELVNQAKPLLENADSRFQNYEKIAESLNLEPVVVKSVRESYQAYRTALNELIQFLYTNELQKFLDQPTQGFQDKFESAYYDYRDVTDRLYKIELERNDRSYISSLWALGTALVLMVSLALLAWIGSQHMLIRPLNNIIEHIRRIATGDLTRRTDIHRQNEIGVLADSLRHMQNELAATVHTVRQGADAIYAGATEISAGNNDLSSRTEQQASSLEETAASMEQLTATVKQNAENARQASQLALSASEIAQKGGKVVDNVVTTMHNISGSSQKIADITNVIDSIAFQTNILALNAAVEAARAGEQGRGFAVVAGEVRSLAQRSAQAAKEIKSLIDDSVSRVEDGSVLVESAGETMAEIVSAVLRVTDIMAEIASASDEQSKGIDQVGQAVTEMDRVTQQNASLVEESAAASAALEEQANILSQAVAVFRLSDVGGATGRVPGGTAQAKSLSPLLTKPATVNTKAKAEPSSVNWETF